MPKHVIGGATSKYGKKVVGLYLTPEFNERLKAEADKRGISRSAFILNTLYEALEKNDKAKDG